MRCTFDQLVTLETIHRLGSFSAAGKALNRATSAISYSVKGLEEALGVVLFDRTGHRAALTDAGRLMLEESRRVLQQARRLEQVARELHAGYEPVLSVVLDGILPMPPVMRAMRAFVARHLPTRIRLMVEYLTGVTARFVEREAAMMLVLDYEGDEELSAIALPKVDMYLVAHRDHPLNQGDARVDRPRLAEHVELVVADSSRRSAESTHRLFLGSPQVFELSDFHSKREALLGGVGYGWLPDHLAHEAMKRGDLVQVPFEEGAIHTFEPHLVYRNDPPLGPAGRLFRELLLEQVSGGVSGVRS